MVTCIVNMQERKGDFEWGVFLVIWSKNPLPQHIYLWYHWPRDPGWDSFSWNCYKLDLSQLFPQWMCESLHRWGAPGTAGELRDFLVPPYLVCAHLSLSLPVLTQHLLCIKTSLLGTHSLWDLMTYLFWKIYLTDISVVCVFFFSAVLSSLKSKLVRYCCRENIIPH